MCPPSLVLTCKVFSVGSWCRRLPRNNFTPGTVMRKRTSSRNSLLGRVDACQYFTLHSVPAVQSFLQSRVNWYATLYMYVNISNMYYLPVMNSPRRVSMLNFILFFLTSLKSFSSLHALFQPSRYSSSSHCIEVTCNVGGWKNQLWAKCCSYTEQVNLSLIWNCF